MYPKLPFSFIEQMYFLISPLDLEAPVKHPWDSFASIILCTMALVQLSSPIHSSIKTNDALETESWKAPGKICLYLYWEWDQNEIKFCHNTTRSSIWNEEPGKRFFLFDRINKLIIWCTSVMANVAWEIFSV